MLSLAAQGRSYQCDMDHVCKQTTRDRCAFSVVETHTYNETPHTCEATSVLLDVLM